MNNLSDRNLYNIEKLVLSKGLNFGTKHINNDVIHFIAQVEPAIENIPNI